MKRFAILLLMLVVMTTICSSQIIQKSTIRIDSTKIVISDEQLRTANLIFVEHSKLKKENKLLKRQINNYIVLDSLNTKTDSVKSDLLNKLEKENTNLKKKVKKQKKIFSISSLSLGLAFILAILFK